MSDLDTEIKGEVAAIRAVARWLRQDLRTGFDDMATTVAQQRSEAAGDWQGEAGTAFASRAGELSRSADDGATITRDVGTLVDDLAEDMRTAKDAMAAVRDKARAGELDVAGHLIRNPGDGPPSAGTSPAADATPGEWQAWEARDRAVREHNRKVEVWNECVADATAAWETWQGALAAAASAWQQHDTRYVLVGSQLLSAGIKLELIRRATPQLTGEVDRMLTRAAELRGHLDAMQSPHGKVVDRQHYYDLLDEADRLDADHPAARRALSNWEIPKGLTRGLYVIDIAATGYSIHSDWDEEGPTQAIVSNAVPAIASIAAGAASGAYVGGVIGSFVPIPGVGTAAGVVIGAGVGTVVGAFTSGAIDSLFDSGADTLGDWGGAVADGFEEVGATFESIGEGVGDVFDSIF